MNCDKIADGRRASFHFGAASLVTAKAVAKSLNASPLQPSKAKQLVIHLTKRLDHIVKEAQDEQVGEALLPPVHARLQEEGKGMVPAPLKSLVSKLGRGCNSAPTIRKVTQGSDRATDKHLLETYLALKVVGSLPKPDPHLFPERKVNLPPPTKAKTVVFDLDETLVHRCDSLKDAEVVLPVELPSGEVTSVGVNIRPFALQTLVELSQDWEVVVFTASQRCYADAVLDYLDRGRGVVAHRLYREHCLHFGSVTIKDLRVLSHRPLSTVVIIDNAASNFAYQLDNGIPIRPWRSSLKDRELVKLTAFLKKLYLVPDVRTELRKVFDLEHFCEDYRHAFRPHRKGSDQ